MAIDFRRSLQLEWANPGEWRIGTGIATDQGTISFMINMNDIDTNQEIFQAYSTGQNAGCYHIMCAGAALRGSIEVHLVNGGGLLVTALRTHRRTEADVLEVGNWVHILITHINTSSDQCRIYKNGVEVGYSFTYPGFTFPDALAYNWYIGGPGPGPWFSPILNGTGVAPNPSPPARMGGRLDGKLANFGVWHGEIMVQDTRHIESLADGYSPLFFSSFIEASSAFPGLLFAPPLWGGDDGEQDLVSGQRANQIGSGVEVAHPLTYYPAPLMIKGGEDRVRSWAFSWIR